MTIDFLKLKNDNAKIQERFDELKKTSETIGKNDFDAQLDFMTGFNDAMMMAIDELKQYSELSELIHEDKLTGELVFNLFPNLDRIVFREIVSMIVSQWNGYIRGELKRFAAQGADVSLFYEYGLRAYLVELDKQAFLKLGVDFVVAGNGHEYIKAMLAYLEQFIVFRQILTDLDESHSERT